MQDLSSSSLSIETITNRIQFLAETYPDRELFVFYNGQTRDSYTSREIFQLAGKFAHRVRHHYGFQKHDIIANTLPNSPERLITDVGIALAGCTCLNGQILLADGSDFLRSAKNSKCRGVILRPEDDASAWRLLKQFVTGSVSAATTQITCVESPEMTSALLVSRRGDGRRKPFLEDLTNSTDTIFVDTTIRPNDLLYIYVTSGSTGYSKLVHRTHAEVLAIGRTLNDSTNTISTYDYPIVYNDRSFGWSGGYPYATFDVGQTRVAQDWFDGHGKKKGQVVWDSICKERCTMAIIRQVDVDSVLRYVESIGGAQFRVNTLGTAGQPLTKAQLSSMFTIAEQVIVLYASTEGGGLAVGTIPSADIGDFYCGKPVPGVQLKVIDDNGHICKPRQPGTILVKGGSIFHGYFNRLVDPDPNTVKCFTKDGWFDTEDIGFLDEDGNVYVMGRNKDTITYGSVVLYPGWLEARIMHHPQVAEACILPVSDPVIYQNICACVKKVEGSDLNEENLKKFCESIFVADLASEQTPMPKYFMVLDSFPETPTGKPDKKVLIKIVEEKFGIGKTTGK